MGRKTHGMTGTPTFKTWEGVKYRCNNSSSSQYKVYKDMLCPEWYTFEKFLDDMGTRPDGMTLDRIDNSKGYSKDNCRWATNKQQQRNRTNTRYLIINNEQIPLMEIAEELGIKKSAAQYFFSTAKKLKEKYGSILDIA